MNKNLARFVLLLLLMTLWRLTDLNNHPINHISFQQASIFERDLLRNGQIPPWSYINVDGQTWIDFYSQPWASFDNAIKTWYRSDYRTSAEYIRLASKIIQKIAEQNPLSEKSSQLNAYADKLDDLARMVYLHRIDFAEQLMSVFAQGSQLLTKHYYYLATTTLNTERLSVAYALKATLLSAQYQAILSGYEFKRETAILFYKADILLDTAIRVQWWQQSDIQQTMLLMTEALRDFSWE